MSSHPSFDPNLLEQQAASLLSDPLSPLLDRAVQGLYPAGGLTDLFLAAAGFVATPSAAVAERWFDNLGFYTAPEVRLAVAEAATPGEELRLSPLQVALAAAALSNEGIRPPPRLAMAVKTPSQGWVILPALSDPVTVLSPALVDQLTATMQTPGEPFWAWSGSADNGGTTITWALGGTLVDWQATPLAVVVMLETNDLPAAEAIVDRLLAQATKP